MTSIDKKFQNALPIMKPSHKRALELLDTSIRTTPVAPTCAPVNLLSMPKQTAPTWLKKAERSARKLEGCCVKCHNQYLKAELNSKHHCRHCADELNETHPMNEGH